MSILIFAAGIAKKYRVTHLLANLGWAEFDFGCSTSLPGSAWADGKFAELAEQLGKMVEHPKSKSTQPRFARRCVALYFRWHIKVNISNKFQTA